MAIRTRKNVLTLVDAQGQWHPDLLWYARAITEMKKRPIADPTSWRYQAAIHDYVRQFDPLAQASDVLPPAAERQRFWGQCQHFSWFFLSWHRMYLFHFEAIVSATIKKLNGPEWALPYWNYSDSNNPDARRLPPAFRATLTPDQEPNPLLVEERNPGCNSGQVIADEFDIDINECLVEASFVAQGTGGNPGFGGPQTGFNHGGGNAVGKVEMTPHGSMHMAVGGFMGAFNTAGLDPLFWLHHCNIDRLWTVWLQRNSSHRNPTQALWREGVKFAFRDAGGNVVEHTSSKMVDTTATPLLYDYDDVTDPLGGVPETVEVAVAEQPIPEMVGATDRPVVVAGRSEARLSVVPPAGPGAGPEAASSQRREIYLNVENITGSGAVPVTGYDVYVNLPPGDDPEAHPELRIGRMPLFGLAEASRPETAHAGNGLKYAYRIGSVVRRLQAQNGWNADDVRIAFVPRRLPGAPDTVPEATPEPITVGRISVYFA